jgi:hypothetical protein
MRSEGEGSERYVGPGMGMAWGLRGKGLGAERQADNGQIDADHVDFTSEQLSVPRHHHTSFITHPSPLTSREAVTSARAYCTSLTPSFYVGKRYLTDPQNIMEVEVGVEVEVEVEVGGVEAVVLAYQ